MLLEEVKSHLRLSFDADDNTLQRMMKTAESYLEDSIDQYAEKRQASPGFAAKADEVMLAIIHDLYEHRDHAGKRPEDYSFIVRSMISQLQYTEV